MEDKITPNPVPEPQPLPEEELASSTPARSIKWFIIGGALVIFLAATAFFGARLLKPQASDAGAGLGKGQMMFTKGGGPGGGAQKSFRINQERAKELPKESPATTGLFVRRQDQSIYIGTGRVTMMAKASKAGDTSPNITGNYDGPVVEVVANHQTQIYQDITEMEPPSDASNGSTIKIQQIVKPGSLDDLGKNSLVTVWGDKQGDRYIAKVIVFR